MLANYLKIALRFFQNNKFYSLFGILGFATGILAWLLAGIWTEARDDYQAASTNRYQIYRLGRFDKDVLIGRQLQDESMEYRLFPESPGALGPAIEEMPGIGAYCRFAYAQEQSVRTAHFDSTSTGIAYVDKSFLDIFALKTIGGQLGDFGDNHNLVLLNRTSALKFFGPVNPVGKKILLGSSAVMTVCAVADDLPEYYNFRYEILAPYSKLPAGHNLNSWGPDRCNTYTLVDRQANRDSIQIKIRALSLGANPNYSHKYYFTPMKTINSYDDILSGYYSLSDSVVLKYLSVISIFLLLISAVNYSNQALSKAAVRFKEIAVRKVLGARRRQLIFQHISEALLLVFLALLLSLAMVGIMALTGSGLGELIRSNLTAWHLLKLLGVSLLTAIVAAAYPAIYMSGQSAKALLSGRNRGLNSGGIVRTGLIVFQMSLAVALVVIMVVVYKYVDYNTNSKIGDFSDNMLICHNPDNSVRIEELSSIKGIKTISMSSVNLRDLDVNTTLPFKETGETKLCIIEANRKFSEMLSGTETKSKLIANHKLGSVIGFIDSLYIKGAGSESVEYIENMALRKDYWNTPPVLVKITDSPLPYFCIKANDYQFLTARQELINIFGSDNVNTLDTALDTNIADERQRGDTAMMLALTALLISLMGLINIIGFITRKRSKEIMIRKIFGAGTWDILKIVLKEYLWYVLAANVIGWIFAYVPMNETIHELWSLNIYSVGQFQLSVYLTLGITLIIVIQAAFRLSRTNPAKALRE